MVADKKSFSKAARENHITQPAVTQRIQALEQEFGTLLIERVNNRRINLTPAGKLVYQYARKIVSLFDEAQKTIQDVNNLIRGKLVVGASTGSGDYFLIPILGEFKKKYPSIEISLELDISQEIISKVTEGKIEVGICGVKVARTGLVFKIIREDEMVLVVSKEHPWSIRDSVSVNELVSEPFIFQQDGSGARIFIEKKLREIGIKKEDLKIVMEIGTQESVKRAVEANLGISILSKMAIEKEIASDTLKEVKIEGLDFKRKFYLVFSRVKHLSPATRAFIEFIESKLSERD